MTALILVMPLFAILAASAEPEKPDSPNAVERKRPERVVPTADRLTGTIVTPNPDGTLKRTEHTIGEPIQPEKKVAPKPADAIASKPQVRVEPEQRFNYAPYVGAGVLVLLILLGWGVARSGSSGTK